MSQNAQARTQLLLESKSRRQELYKAFIEEASKLYGDALVTDSADNADVSKFVGLYAMLGRMRILSSQAVIENAEKIIEVIAKEYFEPNRTLRDMFGKSHELDMKGHELDIIRHFSEACREDLRGVAQSSASVLTGYGLGHSHSQKSYLSRPPETTAREQSCSGSGCAAILLRILTILRCRKVIHSEGMYFTASIWVNISACAEFRF